MAWRIVLLVEMGRMEVVMRRGTIKAVLVHHTSVSICLISICEDNRSLL